MSKENWTTKNIPDLSNKTIIITGANSGLGFATSKALANNNATVVMACRNIQKGETAKSTIMKECPHANIEVMELDLMDLSSVKSFAQNFIARYHSIDILINNAGIMMPPYFTTKDGFESQLGTNHLGHFALTAHLLDMLKKSPGARVINVSSMAHKQGDMDFENLNYDSGKGYSPIKAYGRSKLANLLFTYQLQRFFEEKHIDAISVAAHPGVSNTNLGVFFEKSFLYKFIKPILSKIIQAPSMGSLPQIRAAVDPEVKGNDYYGPGGWKEFQGFPVKTHSNQASHNIEDARKLWAISEALTEVKFA